MADSLDFNGSILITRYDKPWASLYRGYQDFKTKTPTSPQTSYAIGSVSKQFTAVQVLKRVEQGQLKLNTTLGEILGTQGWQSGITLHQLMTHTSGLSDTSDRPHPKVYRYSNKGYFFLQQVIEKVSGRSFSQNIKDLVRPIGMQHTTTAMLDTIPNFASAWIGNTINFQRVEAMPQRLTTPQISLGAGGIVSTAQDLSKWNNAIFRGKLLSTRSLKSFITPFYRADHYLVDSVGYGYGIMQTEAPPFTLFHTGYVKGSASLNLWYPKSRTSVIVLSNLADETKGKDYIFRMHRAVKRLADSILLEK